MKETNFYLSRIVVVGNGQLCHNNVTCNWFCRVMNELLIVTARMEEIRRKLHVRCKQNACQISDVTVILTELLKKS